MVTAVGEARTQGHDEMSGRRQRQAAGWTTFVLAAVFAVASFVGIRDGTRLFIKLSPSATSTTVQRHQRGDVDETLRNKSKGFNFSLPVPTAREYEEGLSMIPPQGHQRNPSPTPLVVDTGMMDKEEKPSSSVIEEETQQRTSPQSSSLSKDPALEPLAQQWRQYQKDLYESTAPNANLTTGAFTALQFTNGYRNQATIFCWVIMEAMDKNISQILLPSLRWKDYLGSNSSVRHEDLFDVVHWNSFYPALPRLVRWDPTQHPHIRVNTGLYRQEPSLSFDNYFFGQDDTTTTQHGTEASPQDTSSSSAAAAVAWAENTPKRNENRHPKKVGPKGHFLMYLGRYNQYVKNVESGKQPSFHPADVLIMRQSSPDRPFRPHPVLRYMMKEHMTRKMDVAQANTTQQNGHLPSSFYRNSNDSCDGHNKDDRQTSSSNYLALHARIEPDMQRHPFCHSIKVRHLQELIEKIYKTFPNTPCHMTHVLLVLSRQLLEDEVRTMGTNSTSSTLEQDGFAARNLAFLDRLVKEGMWNGTVAVVEGGMSVFRQERGENRQLLAASTLSTTSKPAKLVLETLKSFYRSKPLLVGAIVDFSLSIDASWFLGTEISTFSRDIFAARLYHNDSGGGEGNSSHSANGNNDEESSVYHKNYKYLPRANLQPITEVPPFKC